VRGVRAKAGNLACRRRSDRSPRPMAGATQAMALMALSLTER